MKFDYEKLSKEAYQKAQRKAEENTLYGDTLLGQVTVGNLCIDFITMDSDENVVLTYDVYVGWKDTGYAYKGDAPYDYADGRILWPVLNLLKMSYSDFQKEVEKRISQMICENKELLEKAEEEPTFPW